ncbi:Sortase family protein [Promicromonospora umidemergens]|uniref:Sortase family protein n=1 Tax=Promicromonospora umidemergens TaxID=629679 RepID=A0ABP8XIS2_9MICO|nr:sortase [Promicromonospora umidemergens]MCP2285684.1 Sortase family protein [Promicromonospora umidemergens]
MTGRTASHRPHRLLRRPATVAALVLALLLGGCATTSGEEPEPGTSGNSSTALEDSFAAGGLQDPSEQDTSGSDPEAPERIHIPSIGVDSGFESLGIGEGGRLDAPVDYDLAGWYEDGVVPGEVGPAIIAGHVDSRTAPGIFVRLEDLDPGEDVVITMTDGTRLTFEVTGATRSPKTAFPTAEVYSNVPTPDLRLVTCTGRFDASSGHYVDNLVVFATLRD